MACSAECLARHRHALHPEQAGLDARARAMAFAASINGRFPDNWQRYASHRRQLMQLVEGAGFGGKLAVFGAGNAADLELDWLVQRSVPGLGGGYGHCTFTPQELTQAFFDLVVWGEYGVKPTP